MQSYVEVAKIDNMDDETFLSLIIDEKAQKELSIIYTTAKLLGYESHVKSVRNIRKSSYHLHLAGEKTFVIRCQLYEKKLMYLDVEERLYQKPANFIYTKTNSYFTNFSTLLNQL